MLSQKEILIPSSYITRLSHERFFKKWPLNSSIKNDCSRKSNHKIKKKNECVLVAYLIPCQYKYMRKLIFFQLTAN